MSRRRTRRGETGFTLIELLVVITIMPLIVGAISVALLAVLKNQTSVSNSLTGSGDAANCLSQLRRGCPGFTMDHHIPDRHAEVRDRNTAVQRESRRRGAYFDVARHFLRVGPANSWVERHPVPKGVQRGDRDVLGGDLSQRAEYPAGDDHTRFRADCGRKWVGRSAGHYGRQPLAFPSRRRITSTACRQPPDWLPHRVPGRMRRLPLSCLSSSLAPADRVPRLQRI